MNRLASRLRILVAAATVAGLATACFTPSVPLPPPLIENMTFTPGTAAKSVVLSSPPEASIGAARFSVFNVSQGVGVIIESAADGSFTTPPFPGVEGDYIDIYYERGTDTSDRCTTLHVNAKLIGSSCH